jgi:pimeloyl-ACP methyl ester carboxylesterase
MVLASTIPPAAAATDSDWAVYAHPQRLVDVGGRRLNLYCLGKGAPTVILESGLGSDVTTWRYVHSKLAKTTRVCAYDRAGYGFSDIGPEPRTAASVTSDLVAMLHAAKIPPPYVLVGQSLGGLYVRFFADTHFSDVTGLVFLDPSFEHQVQVYTAATPSFAAANKRQHEQLNHCVAVLTSGRPAAGTADYEQCVVDSGSQDLPPQVVAALAPNAGTYRMAISELEGLEGASSEEVEQAERSYGEMPLLVLTADVPPNADADELARRKLWVAAHDRIAHLSTRGENRIVPGADHHIHWSRPEAVIAAVEEIVAAARAKTKR